MASGRLMLDNRGQNEALVDFPVLIVLDTNRIDYAEFKADGTDIRFADADGVTPLDYEIESWTPGGTSYVWVRVPQVNANVATDSIVMYWDKANAGDAQSPEGTWRDYLMVHHLNETSGGHQDSTANNNDAIDLRVAQQGTAQGVIGPCDRFTNSPGSRIKMAYKTSLNVTKYTVEAWTKVAPGGRTNVVLGATDGTYETFFMERRPAGWHAEIGDSTAWLTQTADFNATADPEWRYVAYSASVLGWNMYIDGTNKASGVYSGLPRFLHSAQQLTIGEHAGARNFVGLLDEVRISGKVRSEPWLRAQNKSMRDANYVLWLGSIDNGIGATFVRRDSATLNGEIVSYFGTLPTVKIYYGDNDGGVDPLAWDASVTVGSHGRGPFSAAVGSLNTGVTYYYRCMMANNLGETWATTSGMFITVPNGTMFIIR
jgi:hypothetical protein